MPTTDISSGLDGLVRQSSTTSFAQAVSGGGNFSSGTFNQVANVQSGTTFFCGRTFFQFDTTSIATDQVATAATITVRLSAKRGGTTDDTENHKMFISTNHAGAFGNSSFDTVGDACSDVVDVASIVGASLTFTLDSTGIAYINTQLGAGNKCAFLQRCQNDYQNPGVDPSGVNFRTFNDLEDATSAFRPVLSITHDTSTTGFGNNVIGVGSGNIAEVIGVATANIEEIIGNK
mgnify:CR=1 FL=1|tara:strand:- start:403 stop:1101 length:699 start_codon:yes stop_codon:yes gene_type:complete